MKTLAQIRAINALNSSRVRDMGIGQNGGDALSGFPLIIKSCGLLAATAFAIELKSSGEPKHEGARLIMLEVAKHLSDSAIAICEACTARDLVEELAHSDSSQLRRATAEALAFLSYLKRFVA